MSQCIECRYYSMWDGVCMCPGSRHLWTCFSGTECEDFRPDDEEEGQGEEKEG